MLPFQRNKIDLSKLNAQEQELLTKYGKLPTHKSVLMKMQKERKYFDSGDYALSKAGVAPQNTVGTAIPNPENIPHATPGNGHSSNSLSISPTNSTSPVNKESGLVHHQEAIVAEQDDPQKPQDDSSTADKAPGNEDMSAEETVTTTRTRTTPSGRVITEISAVESSHTSTV